MNDLVERLRRQASHALFGALFKATANRIESLERENAELRTAKEQARREALEVAAKVVDDLWRSGMSVGSLAAIANSIRSLIQAEREEE